MKVLERDVEIQMGSGVCDAAFFYPEAGRHPGVLVWADAFGLRPAMREMAARLAAEGYAVLVPNLFYRVRGKGDGAMDPAQFDFQNPETWAKLGPLMGSVKATGHAEGDGEAYIGFLDGQAEVDMGRKIGVHGYCLGGALSLRTAAAMAHRVGAVGSFHGGGLVTDQADSPHLLAPMILGEVYIGIAADDEAKQPEAKEELRAAFEDAAVVNEVEVYEGAMHGWCVRDMPAYEADAAERAWAKLLGLYGRAL